MFDKKILPIAFLTFVNVINFSILIPVLPDEVGRHVTSTQLSIIYGLVLSSYAIAQFFAAPILGAYSDKYGRKPLLIISQAGTLLSWVLFLISSLTPSDFRIAGIGLGLGILIIARIGDGLTGGNDSIASAYLADITTKEERTKIFGKIGSIAGLGIITGPAIGGFFYKYGLTGVSLVAITISTITLVTLFLLKESLPEEKRNKTPKIDVLSRLNVFNGFSLITNRFIKALTGVRFLFAFVFGSFTTLLALVLRNKYGFDSTSLGVFYSFVGVYLIFNQYFTVGFLAKKLGTMKAFSAGLYIFVAALCVFPFIPNRFLFDFPYSNWVWLLIFPFFFGMGSSLAFTTFKTLLLDNVDQTKQGEASGLETSLVALGTGVAPIIAGLAYSITGVYTVMIAGLILLIAYVSVRIYFNRYCAAVKRRSGLHPLISH